MSDEPIETLREVGVVFVRRAVDNPWVDHLWSPHGVLFPAPPVEPGTILLENEREKLVYAGPACVELFASDTANYRDNLIDGTPQLWVAARWGEDGAPTAPRATADPTEGGAWFESGADVIGAVPMPADIAAWIAEFVDRFHVERVFLKRQRDRSERGERGRGRRPEDKT
jgi:hypothetical protein